MLYRYDVPLRRRESGLGRKMKDYVTFVLLGGNRSR